MGFTLKVYFLGLVAFLPGPDGDRMTVLVVDAGEPYALSDGTSMEVHEPLLLVRGPVCAAPCGDDRASVVQTMYPSGFPNAAQSFDDALAGGTVWRLAGSDLTLDFGTAGPPPGLTIHGSSSSGTPTDLLDFDWVAEMGRIAPNASTVDPDVLATDPSQGLIAGRLELTNGEILTERLVTLDEEVVDVRFETISEEDVVTGYVRPMADRVVAEIQVPDCQATLIERRFDGSLGRSISLAPAGCSGSEVVEIALINLPVGSFGERPPAENPELVGKHFEIFYELAANRPPNSHRPVPVYDARHVEGEPEATRSIDPSALLPALGFPPRSAFSRPMCPMAQFSGG